MIYRGWWKCRIKGLTKTYPWFYFKVGPFTNKVTFRRAANLAAVQCLEGRKVYELLQEYTPPTIQPVKKVGSTCFYAETCFAVGVPLDST